MTNLPPADYPKPRFPVLPVLSWRTIWGRRSAFPSVLEAGNTLAVTSGSSAIALALRHAGINARHKALLPALHCRSMVEPFLALNAGVLYYRINEDASANLDDIKSKLDSETRVLLVTHYFGFYQNMVALRVLCDAHRLLLIEDCAHAFFGELRGHPIGSLGDYAIASARKFFAISEGGYLVSSRRSLNDFDAKHGGLVFSIRSAVDVIENAVEYDRLRPLGLIIKPLLALKAASLRKIKTIRKETLPRAAAFSPVAMSGASRALVRMSDTARIANLRRANYHRLAEGLSRLPGARALFPALPTGVVPYMFPLLVDDPARVFPILKAKQVPIFRWENLEHTGCEVSRGYAHRLLQLPCHQELRQREIDWMIATIAETLSCPASGESRQI